MGGRPLAWFVGIAFGFSWTLFLIPLAFGAPGTQAHSVAALVAWAVAMWGPGLGAIAAVRSQKRPVLATLGMHRLGRRRAYAWAWLLPPAIAFVTAVAAWALGLGPWDPPRAMAELVGDEEAPFALETLVAIQIAAALLAAPLVNLPLALGEELGWRAFLLPALEERGSSRPGALLGSGAIWGIWHAPAIAQGHNYPGHPVLGIPLMIVAAVLWGVLLGWLYLQTRSVWAPALAHGSLNASAALPVLLIAGVDVTLAGHALSVVGCVITGVAVGILVLWLRSRGWPSGPGPAGAPESSQSSMAHERDTQARDPAAMSRWANPESVLPFLGQSGRTCSGDCQRKRRFGRGPWARRRPHRGCTRSACQEPPWTR